MESKWNSTHILFEGMTVIGGVCVVHSVGEGTLPAYRFDSDSRLDNGTSGNRAVIRQTVGANPPQHMKYRKNQTLLWCHSRGVEYCGEFYRTAVAINRMSIRKKLYPWR